MAKFAIPKTITFEKFGEKFANSELTFRAIPTADFAKLDKAVKKLDDAPSEAGLDIMVGILRDYFISGKFYDEDSDTDLDVSLDDLGLFPSDVMFACFQALTGADRDPKGDQPLTT